MEASSNEGLPRPRPSDFCSIITRRADLVRRSTLFSEISPKDCAGIVACASERHFQRGKAIFLQGDPVRQVILLTSGCIKLSQMSPGGQEVILRLIGPGEPVSAESCTKCQDHCSTARALERSSVLAWESKTFEAFVERFPILLRNVWSDLQRHMTQLEERYREISTQKVAPRLSSQLVRLLTTVGKPSNGHVEIALSQRDLAQLTGTTLFTVSRLLSQWQAQGIVIPRRQGLLIVNAPALEHLSQNG